jgi:hypothetical protein
VNLLGHKVNPSRIFIVQTLITAYKRDTIAAFHQIDPVWSILLCIQMESHGANFNESRSRVSVGKQICLTDG